MKLRFSGVVKHDAILLTVLWYLFIVGCFLVLGVIGYMKGWDELPDWFGDIVMFPFPLLGWVYRLLAFSSGWEPPGWFRPSFIGFSLVAHVAFVWLTSYFVLNSIARLRSRSGSVHGRA